MTPSPAPGRAPRKPKSPPVPSRTLKDCFDDVRKIFERYSHGTFSRSEIASSLGMSATSGQFDQRIYTLRTYGLVDNDGGNFKVSNRFLEMHASGVGSTEFKRNALNAIRGADTLGDLLREFNDRLPQQEVIVRRLETQRRFNSDRAKMAARVFEGSLRFAGVVDASGNIVPVRDDGTAQQSTIAANAGVGDDATSNLEGGGSQVAMPADLLRMEIPLAEGRRAVVAYPPELSSSDAEKISRVLQALAE